MKYKQLFVACVLFGYLSVSAFGEIPSTLPATLPSSEYRDRKQLFAKLEQKLKAEAEYDGMLRDTEPTFQASLDGQLLLAYLAGVDGREATAIVMLDKIVASGSDKPIPGLSVPASLGARFWRLTMFRHTGQIKASLREMDEIQRLPLGKGQEVDTAMLLLYRAELMEAASDNAKAEAALADVEGA